MIINGVRIISKHALKLISQTGKLICLLGANPVQSVKYKMHQLSCCTEDY